MSYSYTVASTEFTSLCQSQIRLLTQGFGAMWSVVYLTEELTESQQTKLLPFVIYPQTELNLQLELPERDRREILQQVTLRGLASSQLLLPDNFQKDNSYSKEWEQQNLATKQLILPLIYQDAVLGLLVTGREDRNWEKVELKQIEEIARTIAIARFLERQSQWYREQLRTQQDLYNWEQDRLDDLFHQLRNPLTALRTFSKLLLKRFLPDSKELSIVQSILRESKRLSDLLQQFETDVEGVEDTPLTLSTTSVRLSDANGSSYANFLLPDKTGKLESVQLEDILDPLLLTARAIASNKKLTIITKIPDTLPLVYGNKNGLVEVVNNLIDNAIKYTPAQGKIVIEIARKEELLGLVISDTGSGIPQEDRGRVFERHYRGIQAEGEIPGTGLGLAIAKELVTQMRGNIELISPNNLADDANLPGTTFIVWLSIVV